MARLVCLKTLCGCSKYIMVEEKLPPEIHIPLVLNPLTVITDENSVPICDPLKIRIFIRVEENEYLERLDS